MAEAQSALSDEAASRRWLTRAASAPREDGLSAESLFCISADGWRRLIHDYMDHGRLSPPSLEMPPPGVSDEELALPPPAPLIAPADLLGDLSLEAVALEADNADTDQMLDREAAAARGVS
jgi:HemY protein